MVRCRETVHIHDGLRSYIIVTILVYGMCPGFCRWKGIVYIQKNTKSDGDSSSVMLLLVCILLV